jgi:hypothetical protein
MISLSLAQKLKSTGLTWNPQLNDFFAIPERGLDEKVFVISEVSTYLGVQHGLSVIHFHGAEEWALDQIAAGETVWLPTEEQLRLTLEQRLLEAMSLEADLPLLTLARTATGYGCSIQLRNEALQFEAGDASEVYGLALLFVLERS